MHVLPPLPPHVSPISDADAERLKRADGSLWTDPARCLTCGGTGTFLSPQGETECDCLDQWLLHTFLLNAGIPTRYQRYTWDDVDPQVPSTIQALLMKYAEHAALHVRSGLGMILHGPNGCIQGDAEIGLNRGGKGFRMALRDVVAKFTGTDTPHPKTGRRYSWDLTTPTFVQREAEDGTIRLGRLTGAWCSGVKQTYTVTTDTGRTIRATDEHPFLTERGWLRLDELKAGDEVHVRGAQATGQERQPKPCYRQVSGLRHHPHAIRKSRADQAQFPEHRLVAEAVLNGLAYEVYLGRLRAGEVAGLTFLDPEIWAVHHKDHDSLNNEPSNLQWLTHEEHHRLHAHEGKTRSVLYKVALEEVVSVEPYGEEMTYDLAVEDDPHNFLANGFVVHNTGKTLLCTLLLKHLLAEGFDGYFTQFNDLLDAYTAGWRNTEDRDWFVRRVRNAGVLVVDDVGKESKGRSEMVGSVFDQVIRARVASARPTIITTNYSPAEMHSGYTGSVMSLLAESSVMHEVPGMDFRTRANQRTITDMQAGVIRPLVLR